MSDSADKQRKPEPEDRTDEESAEVVAHSAEGESEDPPWCIGHQENQA